MTLTLLALLAGSAALSAAPAPKSVTLVRNGRSSYRIVVAADASPAVRRGAAELQQYLKQISGAELPIETDAAPLPKRAILVGPSRHTQALGIILDAARLGTEGFLLRSVGPHLVIAGCGQRGTMYGCSELLEKLGVRWYTPTVTRVPGRKTLTLPVLDETQTPAFEYREPFFYEAFDRDWAARNRTNGFSARLDESTGGKMLYYPFVHSFDELLPRSLYAEHPEYFPVIHNPGAKVQVGPSGRADGYVQRCLTNPDVLRIAIEGVRRWMAEHPEAMIYSVSQNDTYNYCECDRCKALTEKYGADSGLYLWFVNQVAEAIEKEHPDKLIDTLAYQFTEAAPTGIKPRKNVRVRLCPIACCEAHPYEQCTAPQNRAFLEALRSWSKITDGTYVWHYNTDFAHYLMPFPDFAEFPAEARLYLRSGVKGIFFQGAYAQGGGGSDAELRSWVMAKLLWNVNVDTDALVTEWMQGVYGPAWKPMRRWFDLLHEKVRDPNAHLYIYDSPTKVPHLTPETIAEGDRLFDEAERLAGSAPTAADYVAKSRLWLRYSKLVRKPSDSAEFRSFMADVRKRGITQLREGQELDAWEQQYLATAGK
jgi:hypothetical protein